MCVGGEGGAEIFIYIRRLGPFLGVQNLEFQYFWGGSEISLFLGVWRFCGYIITKLDWSFLYISGISGVFLKSMWRMGILFWVAQNYKYFLGSGWYSRYILGVDSRCWVQAYVWRKTWEYITMSKFKTPKYTIKCAQNIGCTCPTWEQP